MLESNKFVNSTSIKYSITDFHDHTGKINGIEVLTSRWRYIMNKMEFSAGMTSSDKWSTYIINGKTSAEVSETSAVGLVNILTDLDYVNGTISNSMTVNYRKINGDFFVYVGNVEDFFSQFINYIKPVHIKKIAKKYNV